MRDYEKLPELDRPKYRLMDFYRKNVKIIDDFNSLLKNNQIKVDKETLDVIGDTHHKYMIILAKILKDNGVEL